MQNDSVKDFLKKYNFWIDCYDAFISIHYTKKIIIMLVNVKVKKYYRPYV